MRDRVAEVLAERATLDRGAAAGLALSVALHAGFTAAIVYAALHHPAPEMTNVLNIKFAPVAAAPEPLTPAAPAPAPVAPEVVKPTPAPQLPPITAPKPIEKPAPVPIKNTAPPDAFGRSTRKPAEVPIPQTHPAVPTQVTQQPGNSATAGGVAHANDIAPGTSGVSGIEGGDFPYTIYIDRMKSLIGTHWFRPQGATATATIHFTINRDGTIRDVMLEKASGDGTFDRAAQRAVMEASPLPPLPFAFSGNYLGVHLTFR
jgi:TonB family protein